MRGDPDRNWLLNYPRSDCPACFKSFQSAALNALKKEHVVQDMAYSLYRKSGVTLESLSETIPPIPFFCYNNGLRDVLVSLLLFPRMCWLKAISGVWCTSVRLHSISDRPCIFGCVDSTDELVHYLICPVLRLFASETMKIQEPSLQLEHRLCLCEPIADKFPLFAFCHSLHHACVNDTECLNNEGLPNYAQIAQLRILDLARHCCHLATVGQPHPWPVSACG